MTTDSTSLPNGWLPFLRLGYSDGGAGTVLDRRYLGRKGDLIGLGLNWGRPSVETFLFPIVALWLD